MAESDTWIKARAEYGMIEPFTPSLVRYDAETDTPLISYGLSSYGYDLRLSGVDFKVFRHVPGTVVDPKHFNPKNLETVPLRHDAHGAYFVLPGLSYGLGVAYETLRVPSNVTIVCLGKSTYARCGIIVNVTPAEAGWHGHLTLEFSNSSPADCRLYAWEGVCQLLFNEGDPCQTTYADRNGKYQNQPHAVVPARL